MSCNSLCYALCVPNDLLWRALRMKTVKHTTVQLKAQIVPILIRAPFILEFRRKVALAPVSLHLIRLGSLKK